MPMTSQQHWERSHRQFADRSNLFVEIMQGPNPNSPDEIDRLAAHAAGRYERFAGFGATALLDQGSPVPMVRPVPAGWEAGFYRVDPTIDFHRVTVVADECIARRLAFGWPTRDNQALRRQYLGRNTFLMEA